MSKLWAAAGSLLGLVVVVLGGMSFMDTRHASSLELAQTASMIQADVTAVRIQQIRWELDDINARIDAGKANSSDKARKVELEGRLLKLVGK